MKHDNAVKSIFALSLLTAPLHAGTFSAKAGGELAHENPSIEIQPALFTTEWGYKGAEYNVAALRDDGVYPFSMTPYGKKAVDGTASFSSDASGVAAKYVFKALADSALNCLFVTANLQAADFRGGTWQCGEKSGTFPDRYKELMLLTDAAAGTLQLTTADGSRRVTFTFPAKTAICIQDNRQWGETFSLRMGRLSRFDFKQGDRLDVAFTVSVGAESRLHLQRPVTLTAGGEWIPLDVELEIAEGSALDFAGMGFTDAPAGKHGWLKARGPHFEFESLPGVNQRFYGVNFCFSALYPEKETADRVARRLAQIGYNSVRVHHHDSAMTEGSADGAGLNAEAMRKFDYFMAALINQGLYLSTDLFISRKVPWRAIGIDKPGNIPQDTFKKLVPVHEGAYENLRRYVTAWFTHVNPHTGRSYAEEPALAWISIINEGNFGNHYSEIREIPEWGQAWQKWLAEKKRAEPEAYRDIPESIPPDVTMHKPDPHKAAFLLFFRDLETTMINRFKALLREELGCKALITNANGWSHYLPDHFTRARTYDFIDEHFYVDHPRFIQQSWRLPSHCPNTNPVRNSGYGCRSEIYMRHYDKPFTISEYNYSAPGRFRGVGGILTGTLAALQDWSGLWRFSYSHNLNALSSAGSHPLGYFDMLSDPLALASERASLCLFLRGDIAPLPQSAVVHLPESRFHSPSEIFYRSKSLWPALGWSRKVGIQVGGKKPQGYTHAAAFPEVFEEYARNPNTVPFIGADLETLVGQNRALRIDNRSGTFAITTEKTCGGFSESGVIDAGPLQATLSESAATIWVSSLDNLPISGSKRLLLTHLTDIQNNGIKYAEVSRQTLLEWGGLPHIARRGVAEIDLALASPASCRVYTVSTGGRRTGDVAVTVENGRVRFRLDTAGSDGRAVLLYEIVNEAK